MRHFIIISNTVDTSASLSINSLTAFGRLDVICRCVTASFYLSDGFRKNVTLSIIFLKTGKIMQIQGEEVRGINPDERAIAGVLRKVFSGKTYPGIIFYSESFDNFISNYDPIVLTDTKSQSENLLHQYNTYIIGDQAGFSEEFKQQLDLYPKASLGSRIYLSSQTITILNYLIDRFEQSLTL